MSDIIQKIIIGIIGAAIGYIVFLIKEKKRLKEKAKDKVEKKLEEAKEEKKYIYQTLFDILTTLKADVEKEDYVTLITENSNKQLKELFDYSTKSFKLDNDYILLLKMTLLLAIMSVTSMIGNKDRKDRVKKAEDLFKHLDDLRKEAK